MQSNLSTVSEPVSPRQATLILLCALSVLPLSLFLPSLPAIARDLHADYALVALSLGGYAAVAASLEFVMGPLSDRFGLWLGFHNCSQDTFFEMVRAYARHFGLAIADEELIAGAVEWSMTRGGRSGRVAWQYIQDVAGRLGVGLE